MNVKGAVVPLVQRRLQVSYCDDPGRPGQGWLGHAREEVGVTLKAGLPRAASCDGRELPRLLIERRQRSCVLRYQLLCCVSHVGTCSVAL